MSEAAPVLHMLCGLAASGKSTLAARLASEGRAVLVSEDTWLGALYADQMSSIADYVRCSQKLRNAMGPHVTALLGAGTSVVLDFPANTIEARRWMKSILEETGAAHVLHLLDVPEETCLARLMVRNASGGHPFAVTEAQFRQISRHFAPPAPEEGFTVEIHREQD